MLPITTQVLYTKLDNDNQIIVTPAKVFLLLTLLPAMTSGKYVTGPLTISCSQYTQARNMDNTMTNVHCADTCWTSDKKSTAVHHHWYRTMDSQCLKLTHHKQNAFSVTLLSSLSNCLFQVLQAGSHPVTRASATSHVCEQLACSCYMKELLQVNPISQFQHSNNH